MAQKLELIKNAANRKVPTIVNGLKSIPFKGITNKTVLSH